MAGICDFADTQITPPIPGAKAAAAGAARQGTRFHKHLSYSAGGVALPLTGVGIRMQIREHEPINSHQILTFTLGGYIIVTNAGGGLFDLDVPATVMTGVPMSVPEGYWYDLKLIPAGDEAQAFALFYGRFVVKEQQTQ